MVRCAWAVGLCLSVIGGAAAESDAAFPVPVDTAYVAECGACHTAYAPGLLPARSWRRLFSELDRHFGTDASLDGPQGSALRQAVSELAADSADANALMRRIAASIPAGETPQSITATPFFKYMHDEVPGYIWQRPRVGRAANCGACHTRADAGRYYEREVRIPQ